jgi:lambda family phage tail tape measure protein
MADTVKIVAEFQDNATGAVNKLNDAVKQLGDNANKIGGATPGVSSLLDAITGKSNAASDALDKTAHMNAGVTREVIVLGHEVLQGNFSRIPGSLMVLAERSSTATAALGMLAGGGGLVALALGGLLATVAGVGYAMYEADKHAKAFAGTLALTGNLAGLNKSNFDDLTQSLATSAQVGYGKAEEAMMGLARAGNLTTEQIKLLGPVVIDLSRLTGESTEKVTEQMSKMAEGPTKWMDAWNKVHPIFTAQQQQEVAQLEATGHQVEAATVLAKALNDYLAGDGAEGVKKQIGLWAEWGKNLKDNLHGLGIMTGIIPDSLEQQLVKINNQIEKMQALKGKHTEIDAFGNPLEFDQKSLDALLAKRLEINDKYVAEMKKSNEQQQKANDSRTAQEIRNETAAFGVKSKKREENELAALASLIKKAEQMKKENPDYQSEALDPTWQRQAKQGIEAKYRNPIDDSAARKAYQASIQAQNALIQEQKDSYTNLNAGIKEKLAEGVIDQKQAADATEQLKKDELLKQVDFVNAKIALADAEVKRSGGRNALEEQVRYHEELKHLYSLMELAGIEHDTRVAEADKKALEKKKIILAELTKIDTDIVKEATASQDAQNKELAKITMTADQAALSGNLDKVKSKFDQMRASVTAALTKENADPQVIIDALAKISNAEDAQLAKEREYYNQKKAITEDWKTGAIKAYNDYQAAAENQAQHFATLMGSITSGLESTIEGFMTTGKLSLSSLEQSFTQTLNKMVAQALTAKLQQALFGGLTGGGGSAGFGTQALGWIASMFGGARAEGGGVDAGKIYQINEKGPEFFKPSVGGTVIPMGGMKQGAQGTVVNMSINAVDAPSFRNLVQSDGRFIADMVNKTTRMYNLGV